MQSEPEFLTAKQVAERIGRTVKWVHNIRKKPGDGPPFYHIGRLYLYRPQEIMAWLRARRSE